MAAASYDILFASDQCPSCTRFLEAARRVKGLLGTRLRVSDVQADPATAHQMGVSAVPSIRQSDGRMLTGTACFEWLKQFEADAELNSVDLAARGGGGGGAGFAAFDADRDSLAAVDDAGSYAPF